MTFKLKKDLKQHFKLTHQSLMTVYTCSTCAKPFNYRCNYKRHIRWHRNLLKKDCPICRKTFNRYNINKHIERYHGVQVIAKAMVDYVVELAFKITTTEDQIVGLVQDVRWADPVHHDQAGVGYMDLEDLEYLEDTGSLTTSIGQNTGSLASNDASTEDLDSFVESTGGFACVDASTGILISTGESTTGLPLPSIGGLASVVIMPVPGLMDVSELEIRFGDVSELRMNMPGVDIDSAVIGQQTTDERQAETGKMAIDVSETLGLASPEEQPVIGPLKTVKVKKKREGKDEAKFFCSVCAYGARDQYNLKKHHDSLHSKRLNLCKHPYCTKYFPTKFEMLKHLDDCFLHCPWDNCFKKFKSQSVYESHQRAHTNYIRRL